MELQDKLLVVFYEELPKASTDGKLALLFDKLVVKSLDLFKVHLLR